MRDTVGKWNYETKKYDVYKPDFGIVLMADLDTFINCSACGELAKFGECFTSQEIHNPLGFGYPVCEKCYAKETLRRHEDADE